MQAELNSDVALSAANALVSHLRRDPLAAEQPRELAATFGLDEAFVAQVLQGIHANRRAEVRPPSTRPNYLRVLGRFIHINWIRATSRPVRFIVITQLVGWILTYGVSHAIPVAIRGASDDTIWIVSFLAALAVLGSSLVLQMLAYFFHRRARLALWGAGSLFATTLAIMGYGVALGNVRSVGVVNPLSLFLLSAIAAFILSLMYAGAGSLAAVLGGWARIKLLDRAEETMSRQELLERYFELQSRLQRSAYPRAAAQDSKLLSQGFVAWYRRFQFIPNVALGLMLSGVESYSIHKSGVVPGQTEIRNLSIWFFVLIFASVFGWLVRVPQGYVSKSAWQALLGGLCISIGTTAAKVLYYANRPGYDVANTDFLIGEMIDASLMAVISCGSYLGAVVRKRALRDTNLEQNDQATLLAEMVRIQWKLSNEAATICVLVVDAAKSSEMKASADPLSVEYSFREYQEWIDAICRERGGRVHSTAGDGAVVAFTTCALALSAARRIQSDVFEFNKEINRLTAPFRLRIGLHTGEVVGDINEVQFTEVIDIAAHIESACPIGGIAVTDDVAQRLPEESFIALSLQVDNHEVFIVSNPTEYH